VRRTTLALAAVLTLVATPAIASDESARLDEIVRLAEQGHLDSALGLATIVVADRPDDVDAHVVYQDLARAAGQSAQLPRKYRARARTDGATVDDVYLYARVLGDRSAVTEYRRALKVDPQHLRTLLAVGAIHLNSDASAQAQEIFTRATEVAPDQAAPLLGLAEAVRRTGDFVWAEDLLRTAVELEPRLALAQVELGMLLLESWRYDDARAVLETAAERFPEDPLPCLALGQLERVLGRDEVALAEYDARRRASDEAAALQTDESAGAEPSVPEESRTAGTRAIEHFQAALDRDARSLSALVLLAHSALTSGEHATALAAIATGLRIDATSAETLGMRAYLELDELRAGDAERTAPMRPIRWALTIPGIPEQAFCWMTPTFTRSRSRMYRAR
jgi:tetratricopeptide (TPR) repeat protein